jgi:hypothetical protein
MFALPHATRAHVRTFNLRTEKHGDDDVTAMDLGMRVTGSSALLDMLHPGLRGSLYLPPDETQATIPGETPPWTVLRCDAVPFVTLPKYELIGRNVVLTPATEIESELSEDDELQLSPCNVNGFKVTAHAGGSVDIDFRIQCANIDSGAIGMAGAMLAEDVDLSVTHTEVAETPPAASTAPKAEEKSATDLFVEGAEKPDPDRVPWPFPTGNKPPDTFADVNGGAPPAHLTEPKVSKAQRKRDDAAAKGDGGVLEGTDRTTAGTIGQP